MSARSNNIVQLSEHREPPVKRRGRSLYEIYALPFFDAEQRCTWAVKPSGDYAADCKTGRPYAQTFLRSCDGTAGWSSLLVKIVSDMIRRGPEGPGKRGLVVGFMSEISRALSVSRPEVLADLLALSRE
jgi:hypothetical protein